jgi:hypothetical protein
VRNWIITIAALLLAGAVVNFAVAWACSAFARLGNQLNVEASPSDEAWLKANAPFLLNEDWPLSDAVATKHGFGKRFRVVAAGDAYTEGAHGYRLALGWPLRSVCYSGFRYKHRQDDGSITSTDHHLGRIRFPWASADDFFARADILGAGLAVNSLLYATILCLFIRGPVALRRFIRSSRGLCLACGYPLGESPVCTECGKEARRGPTHRCSCRAARCASDRVAGLQCLHGRGPASPARS